MTGHASWERLWGRDYQSMTCRNPWWGGGRRPLRFGAGPTADTAPQTMVRMAHARTATSAPLERDRARRCQPVLVRIRVATDRQWTTSGGAAVRLTPTAGIRACVGSGHARHEVSIADWMDGWDLAAIA